MFWQNIGWGSVRLSAPHIWDLMKSVGQLWQIFTAIHDEFYGLIICG